ncbi:BLUF domain-containing protein [Solirhodobacter olei]|uniref:BLUF domain-containing protein n=1 Tax=Solirhodobacter olei TaxID=2493082 RepID=UPI000FDBDD23|nr:BLUF domain-containing protein [Solirhodobacter olei]
MKDLLTISYRSVSRLNDPVNDVLAILSESQARNRRLGVTGLLLYDGTYFMQTIEGPPDETGEVFVKIIEDKRHHDVVPFGISSIDARAFPDWQMKLIGPNATRRILPDIGNFDFSDERLAEVHASAKIVASRGLERSAQHS